MPSLLRSRLAVSACGLVACALLAPGAASAAAGDSGPLSPELTQLATPAVAAKAAPAQSAALGFPAEGPGSLLREGDRVIVEAHFEAGALARVEALRAAGAKVLTASGRYQTVALAVEPEDLAAVSAVPGVSAVVPSRAPVFYGAEEGARPAAAASNGLCEGGSVISQGLEQLNVPAARAAFNARGAGETIGVISDSFNSATAAIEGGPPASNAHDDEVSNDLPGPASTCSGQQAPVRVLAEAPASESRTDEGRAMLQIVHDLAPHAQLAFASADYGELAFAHSIEQLALPVVDGGAGANVIVDDVGYFTEPYFQEGPVGEAIQKVTAEGVTYLTAAGNDNLIEAGTEHEIASWERSEFKDTPCPNVVKPEVGEAAANCMNFSPTGTDSTFEISVEPESTLIVDLQWAEAWYGVKTDLDAYLLNQAETEILAANPINNINEGVEIGSPPQPTELIGWENETAAKAKVKLVINRCIHNCNSGASLTTKPRLKFQLLEDGRGVSSTEYKESSKVNGIVMGPTIYGHAGSPAAITLGAVRYSESASAPKEPERYSSRGPVTHYFAPVSGIMPAAELTSAEVIQKPNLTATDCASTTFFAQLEAGAFHFCGTSEAGPHAAAIAALMKQTAPLASPGSIMAKMEASATKYKPPSTFNRPEAVGAGLLNAAGAITALGGSRVEDPPSFVVPSLTEEAAAPAPVVKITKGPKSPGKESRPTFEFSSTRPVTFTCQIDGGAPQACASPYLVPTKLADGTHGFAVTGTDAQGRSGSSGVYAFTIDTKAPKVTIVRHPKKVVRTKKRNIVGRFELRSNEAPVTFYCEIDKEPLRICPKSFHRRFTPGSHVLKVRAMDQAGNLAAKWTSYRFRVTQVGRRSHRNGG
jgi:Subtilase family